MGRVADQELDDPEVRRTYEEELLVGEATETVAGMLVSAKITQRDLARRLGVSEGRVSQILSGGENLTLRSLAALGWALGLRFRVDPVPMADRRGTPAQTDPPAPAWLDRLRSIPLAEFRHLEPAEVSYITMPGGVTVPGGSRSLADKGAELKMVA